jgi:hypothetical protein
MKMWMTKNESKVKRADGLARRRKTREGGRVRGNMKMN